MSKNSILLVEPEFPIPDKSRNHSQFLPVGLLKIGSYHKGCGDTVSLVRGLVKPRTEPDRILVTSLFTYWSGYVHEAAQYYHTLFPKAKIEIGGIYASLLPGDCRKRSPFAEVRVGLYESGRAETISIDYSLLKTPLDYQIIHASRGCVRHCAFCGTWRIEPRFTWKDSVVGEIQRHRLVFYDNNLLANPSIEHILDEISAYRMKDGRSVVCESQSGLDLRFLTPAIARRLRSARFECPRIAWDGKYDDWQRIKEAVMILKDVGYGYKDIFIFMIYNAEIPYEEMRLKLDACRRWKVRVVDCRYRPLDITSDGYVPGPKAQYAEEYYIHEGWSDKQVRGFRRAVRRQNIAILLDLQNGRYVEGCEARKV